MKHLNLLEAGFGDISLHSYPMAVLPWGATEPHNFHLPYLTDSILSFEIARMAAESAYRQTGISAMVLPPISLGAQNPGQRDFPFCIHTRYQTQFLILKDIVESLRHQGIHKLLIVNGHGGNSFKNMIRDLAVDYPDFTVAACEWFRLAPIADYFDHPGEHADEIETSVMMFFHPEWVDMAKAGSGSSHPHALKSVRDGRIWLPRNWKEVSEDTGIGDPTGSTAEKGERFANAVSQSLAEIIIELAH